MDSRTIRQIKGILILLVCIVVPAIVGYKINEEIHHRRQAEVISQFLSYGQTNIVEVKENISNEEDEDYIDLGGDGASAIGYDDATIETITFDYNAPTKAPKKQKETPIPTTIVEQPNTPIPTQPIEQAIDTTGVGVIEGDVLYLDSLFKITYYCACKKCCGNYSYEVTGVMNKTASGTIPQQGRTIAVCKDQIPLGTTVVIDGHEYVAEDTGGAIKWNRIDIYVESHQEALQLGVKKNVRVGIKR